MEGLLVDQRDDRVFDREQKWRVSATAIVVICAVDCMSSTCSAQKSSGGFDHGPQTLAGINSDIPLNIKQYLKYMLYLLSGATFGSLSSLSLKFFPRAGTKRGMRLISALHACNAESLQGQRQSNYQPFQCLF